MIVELDHVIGNHVVQCALKSCGRLSIVPCRNAELKEAPRYTFSGCLNREYRESFANRVRKWGRNVCVRFTTEGAFSFPMDLDIEVEEFPF